MINNAGQICTKQCRTDMPCGDDKQCRTDMHKAVQDRYALW